MFHPTSIQIAETDCTTWATASSLVEYLAIQFISIILLWRFPHPVPFCRYLAINIPIEEENVSFSAGQGTVSDLSLMEAVPTRCGCANGSPDLDYRWVQHGPGHSHPQTRLL